MAKNKFKVGDKVRVNQGNGSSHYDGLELEVIHTDEIDRAVSVDDHGNDKFEKHQFYVVELPRIDRREEADFFQRGGVTAGFYHDELENSDEECQFELAEGSAAFHLRSSREERGN